MRELTQQYPYFASAWALYAKHLHDQNDLRYTTALAHASLLANDRERLKKMIESTFVGTTDAYTLPETEGAPVQLQHQELIDAFLQNKPQQRKVLTDDTEAEQLTYQPAEQQQANDSVLTETLANIYVKQKRYDKALAIFEKLNLKYPEKSTYFASRIKEIQELIKNYT